MNYDVQIGNTIRREVSYAELVELPIEPDTFVRRANSDWLQAKDCIELTHILAQRPITPSVHVNPIYQTDINDYMQEDVEEDDCDYVDEDEVEEIVEEPQYTHQSQIRSTPAEHQQYYHPEEVEEERIFIPTAEYFKCKQKRKSAIIGVCTLGLAGLTLVGIGNTWRSNIFAGTSLSANAGMGFVLKGLSFILLTTIVAIPYFIYSVLALIYYSIRLYNLKR